MSNIQFIQTNPNALANLIDEKIKDRLEQFAENLLPKEPSKFMTRQEVADFLKVDISTVHNYTKRGLLKSYGIERRVLYKRKEVELAIVELQN
jgi:DNA-directed RNA polymerase specialized sigma24 family protein